ncbi:MAG: trypsin-like peptidase domain-containing protein [Planctomycetota bacterium]|nr:trypsin-like peptidase domain-containing protein [Planctomycetota bacterium]
MRTASAATISVFGLEGGGGGSGVVITRDGYALTNYHVSSAAGDHMRCSLNDGRIYDAVIVGIDAVGDLSLIKLLGRENFPTAPLADSNLVRVGQWCFAAGNPFVLASNRQPSVSLGMVSGVNRYQYPAGTLLEYADCIQTDAAINPGNSGGPLFNMAGEVIGINGRCSFEKRGRINVGVGYAISSNQCKYFLDTLMSGRLVDHATLGATVSTDESGKILVSNILPSSDAYRRGLRVGDEVLSFADREVRTTNMFKNILGTLPKEWRVPIEVRRDGKKQSFLVRLEGVHSEKQLIELVSPERSPMPQPQPRRRKESPEKTKENPDPRDASEERVPEELRSWAPNLSEVKKQLEKRKGFANYHFNRTKRGEIWKSLQGLGDFAQTNSSWQLSGTLAGEKTKISLQVNDKQGKLSLGSRNRTVDFGDGISGILKERRERVILVAIRALQQLLQEGPEKIGDSTYLGRMPMYESTSVTKLEDSPRPRVLQSLWYDSKVRFSCDDAGKVRLIEVFGDAGTDPAELYLDNYQRWTIGDQFLTFPSRMRLQFGLSPVLLLQVDSALFGDSAATLVSENEKQDEEEGQ